MIHQVHYASRRGERERGRGHVHMMSALGGGKGVPKTDKSTDKLCDCDSDKGAKKPKTFADVI